MPHSDGRPAKFLTPPMGGLFGGTPLSQVTPDFDRHLAQGGSVLNRKSQFSNSNHWVPTESVVGNFHPTAQQRAFTSNLASQSKWLLDNRSMKDHGHDYSLKVKHMQQFLFEKCGVPVGFSFVAKHLEWFVTDQANRGNQLGTLTGYLAAAEWWNIINGFPSVKKSSSYDRLLRLIQAAGRDNYKAPTPKLALDETLAEAVVETCLQESPVPGTSPFQAAVIFAGASSGGTRINELLRLETNQVVELSDYKVKILLPYHKSKTAKLNHKYASDSILLTGYAAALFFRHWQHHKFVSGGRPMWVFPGARPRHHIAYSTIRKKLLSCLSTLVSNPLQYGTHSFRRGRATHAFRSGVSLKGIRRLLRHKSGSKSTFRYLPKGVSDRHFKS